MLVGTQFSPKREADFMRRWKELKDAFESEKIIKGKIVRRIKGGLIVDLGGQAFLQVRKLMFDPYKILIYILIEKLRLGSLSLMNQEKI